MTDREPDRSPGHTGPLAGITVLDLSRVLTGPYAAMLMGDLGARVIKVERPGVGDETRHWGPPFVGDGDARTSSYFLSVNRNKESIALDLTSPDDHSVLVELIRRSDILVENFRPGVLERLGISHQTIQDLNPRAIVVSITGFGHDGPRSDRAGYDQIIQGEAGLMSMTGPAPDQPTKSGLPIADLSAGMFGVIGALSALHERDRTGRGKVVRTSLLASIVGLHTFQGTRWLIGSDLPAANGNKHPTVAPYGAYPCRDGRLLQVAIGNDDQWRRFAAAIGFSSDGERFATNENRRRHEHELDRRITELMRTRDLPDWAHVLDEDGIPNGAIRSLDEVYDDPQVISQGMVADVQHPELGPIRLPGSPIRYDDVAPFPHRSPPRLDEHGAALRAWVNGDVTERARHHA